MSRAPIKRPCWPVACASLCRCTRALPVSSSLAKTSKGAVIREVKEEVGVDVDDVRYVGSQPWPFPHSLMVGFRVNYTGGDIVCEESEIMDANWYARMTCR